jgi:transcription factor IIIB 90 kDa subunit
LNNAKRVITQTATNLRLPQLYVEKALKLYSNALKLQFMFGRQQSHVVAACLYTICRLEKSSHLLIDFSDTLQVNVYVLGKTFMEFARVLQLQEQLLLIDPALFIHRFVNHFNLGDESSSVITTSLRIITRMKKDWIVSGRRPDGICAAAVMISLRCHGINRTQIDIGKVFRVSQSTLKARLDEFRSLPSSQMTIQEFNKVAPTVVDNSTIMNSDDGYDPPAFRRNLAKEKKLSSLSEDEEDRENDETKSEK